jgi:hypothetical protein
MRCEWIVGETRTLHRLPGHPHFCGFVLLRFRVVHCLLAKVDLAASERHSGDGDRP